MRRLGMAAGLGGAGRAAMPAPARAAVVTKLPAAELSYLKAAGAFSLVAPNQHGLAITGARSLPALPPAPTAKASRRA